MAQRTGIEWTDMSANPIRAVRKSDGKRGHACVHASPGCLHCYSERWNGWRGTGLKFNVPALQQVDIILDQKELTRMRKVKAGNKVFVCDMTDLFGPFVPDAYIIEVFAAMCANQGATWQVLTKRPGRMAALLNDGDFWIRVALAMPSDDQVIPFPPSNIWLGTSVEDQQRANERIPHLLRVPAQIRFLSCEPLLGPVGLGGKLRPYTFQEFERRFAGTINYVQRHWINYLASGIHWLIVGGESGHGARPMHPDWARSLRDQAQAAGVAYFFKQWGQFAPPGPYSSGELAFEDGQRMRSVGKKAAGRLLDDVEWNEFPGDTHNAPAASQDGPGTTEQRPLDFAPGSV